MRLLFCTTTILAVCASNACAAAWTLAKGQGQVIVTGAASASPKGFDAQGGGVDIADYDKQTVDVLIEYGLGEAATVFLKPQLRRVDVQDGDRTSGLGLSELGLRRRLAQAGPWVISAQASALLAGARNRDRIAQAGVVDGEGDVRLLAGRGFKLAGKDAFVDLQGGYHPRLGDPPNEWRGDAAFGVRPRGDVLLLAQSFNVASHGAGRGGFGRYRYHNLWLSAVWDVSPRWALQGGVNGTVAGENALRERGLFVGVWRRF